MNASEKNSLINSLNKICILGEKLNQLVRGDCERCEKCDRLIPINKGKVLSSGTFVCFECKDFSNFEN